MVRYRHRHLREMAGISQRPQGGAKAADDPVAAGLARLAHGRGAAGRGRRVRLEAAKKCNCFGRENDFSPPAWRAARGVYVLFGLTAFNGRLFFLEVAVPKPVVFTFPADVELIDAPISPHWITEGTPRARAARLAISADGTSTVMAWSCSAGRFTWNYVLDEALHVISGEAFVTDEKGEVRRLGPGDMVYFPAGSRSNWYIPHEIRKVAFCRQSMPRPLGVMLRTWNKLVDLMTGFSAGEGDMEPVEQPEARTESRRVTAT